MRLLAVLTAALLVAAGEPAWAWLRSMPGGDHWPAIPEPGGMANFLGIWLPQGCRDAWTEHGNMTLHEGGRISYEKKKPYLATRYRVIETTPHYVVLMTWEPSKKYGEILRFVILQSVSPEPNWPRATLGWNECDPVSKDLAGFSWTDDDAALARVWAGSKSCNPDYATDKSDSSPFFGGMFWNQECKLNRIEPETGPRR